MTFDEFEKACGERTLPASATDLLQSLYQDRIGDWNTAHTIAQSIPTPDGSRVHAYLHRKEGDLGNASYWYSRAGTTAPTDSLDAEWERLAREFTG
jgi:hypothetical protein